jgi:hypothetical protein
LPLASGAVLSDDITVQSGHGAMAGIDSRKRATAAYQRQWYASKKADPSFRENERARKRAWEAARLERDPAYRLLQGAKVRAREKSLEFDITTADVVVPQRCPILGLLLNRSTTMPRDDSPSLDRIDNSLGYVRGNVQVISNRANRLKNDASFEEVEALYFHLKSRREATTPPLTS